VDGRPLCPTHSTVDINIARDLPRTGIYVCHRIAPPTSGPIRVNTPVSRVARSACGRGRFRLLAVGAQVIRPGIAGSSPKQARRMPASMLRRPRASGGNCHSKIHKLGLSREGATDVYPIECDPSQPRPASRRGRECFLPPNRVPLPLCTGCCSRCRIPAGCPWLHTGRNHHRSR